MTIRFDRTVVPKRVDAEDCLDPCRPERPASGFASSGAGSGPPTGAPRGDRRRTLANEAEGNSPGGFGLLRPAFPRGDWADPPSCVGVGRSVARGTWPRPAHLPRIARKSMRAHTGGPPVWATLRRRTRIRPPRDNDLTVASRRRASRPGRSGRTRPRDRPSPNLTASAAAASGGNVPVGRVAPWPLVFRRSAGTRP